jgi:hypothetical protein
MVVISPIYDYVDIHGVNVIRAWLERQQCKAKARLNARLNILEQRTRTEWGRFNVEVLKGDKDGLIAIKVLWQRTQYRLIGYDGPSRGEFTLLVCGKEQNNRYVPLDMGRQAFERIAEVNANSSGRKVRHDFG